MSTETAKGWPAGVGRVILDEAASTMTEAAARAPGPAWVMARRQTAGRGRRGRAWVDPEGNLAATLVMRPEGGPAEAAQRSFVAALALSDALRALLGPGARIALKWPNDVLLNGGKVAGILLESSGQGGRLDYLCIGVGVNLAAAPARVEPGAVAPVSVRGETGAEIAPETLLDALAAAFARRETQRAAEGFAAIRADWLAEAAHLGQTITARTVAETVTGTFDTLAEDGALILATPRGPRRIAAADVYFGGA